MEQGLLVELPPEHVHDRLPHFRRHALRVASPAARHGLHHVFEEEDVFHFGHFRDEDALVAQIFHLGIRAPVAVHYAVAVKMVHVLQVVEAAGGLDHLVA